MRWKKEPGGLPALPCLVLLLAMVPSAISQSVLFEDDFDRGWENAMTHAFLPGWAGPGESFIPPTDITPFDVSLQINGAAIEVWVDEAFVGSYTDSDLQPGGIGVLSWAQATGNFGTIVHAVSVIGSGGTLLDETWEVGRWRRLITTNAEGVSIDPDSARENIRWDFARGRFLSDSNFYVWATPTADGIDFMGTTAVVDVPWSASWTDYEVRVRMLSTDNDGIGLILRALDDDNFYRVVFCQQTFSAGRAPQGVSVQKVRDGTWSELYRSDPGNPEFLYTTNIPFDVTVCIADNPDQETEIQIQIVDNPDDPEGATTIDIPLIVDGDNPVPSGSAGVFQWGNDESIWSSYGGEPTPFLVTLDSTVLVDDPFIEGYNGWMSTFEGGQVAGGDANWGIRLLDGTELIEDSDGRQADGSDDDCQYEPYILVNTGVDPGDEYTIEARLATSDDDGLGIVFGYQDQDNYFCLGLRAQAANYGFPTGVSLRKVVGGVRTCLESALPPRSGLAGIWMQKVQSMTLEMAGDEGLGDESGQDGVEFQGPRLVCGDTVWTDYSWEAVIDARDDDGIGLLFRYQDEQNFYRLTFMDQDYAAPDAPPAGVSVQRVANGVWSEIFRDERTNDEGGFRYDADGLAEGDGFRIWRCRLTCTGAEFELQIDGIDDRDGTTEFPGAYTAVFGDPSPDALLSGRVGVHAWQHNANEFRELRLTLAGQTDPVLLTGFGEPDPSGWVDATSATLSDSAAFTAVNHGDPNGPIWSGGYAGVQCGPVACDEGGYAGSGTPYSGIGLRPDLQTLGVRDNRWISGTTFVNPDDPDTPAYDPDLTRGTFDFDGPRAVAGNVAWTDYVYTVDLKAVDDDGIGLLFRYQDEDNFYRLMFQSEAGNVWGAPPRGMSVQKRSNGVFEEIFFTDDFVYAPGEWWTVEITAERDNFTVRVFQTAGNLDRDETALYLFTFSDENAPLLNGRIGVTVWGAEAQVDENNDLLGGVGLDWRQHFDEGAVFDNVRVTTIARCYDLDGDNQVGLSDLAQLLGHYGMPNGATFEQGDLDGDGDVDLADLAALLGVYGEECGQAFTVVALPDTQVYSESYPAIFQSQTGWIAQQAAACNIVFVVQEGDITNRNTPEQWQNAQQAMQLLDGVVPYAIAPGNHDYGDNGSTNSRETYLNDYFPVSNYENLPTFGGIYEAGHLDNSYHLFHAGGRDWIVIALEWGPRDPVVEWADGVLTQHPDRGAIIVTHAYLYYDDTRYDYINRPDQLWNPHSYGTASLPGGTNDGEELWQELVRHHDNVVLFLNGHVLGDGAGRLSSRGDAGNTVHQVLANYQMRPQGGEGYMRLLEFGADGRTLHVRSYSPYLDAYLTDPQHEFVLFLDAPSE
jgi:hypothetical protein